MPDVTWNRLVAVAGRSPTCENHYTYQGPNGAVPGSSQLSTFQVGQESVTSFRTGKAAEGLDPNLGTWQGDSGSQGDFLKGLKMEYRKQPRSRWDTGHEFRSSKVHYIPPREVEMSVPLWSGYLHYSGVLYPGSDYGYLPAHIDDVSGAQLDADGANQMGRVSPTVPEAGLAQFMAEIREQMPSVIGASVVRGSPPARAIGEENLNYQFGIRPLIADIQKLARSVLTMHSMIEAYKRNSGVNVRRRSSSAEFQSVEEQATVGGNFMPYCSWTSAYNAFYPGTQPVTRVTDVRTRRTWFSGAFTYHVEQGMEFLQRMERWSQLANHLLGTRLNAELVWELTPWSWLLDWVGDVGNFIHNVTMFSDDSLVLRYGYVMCEQHADRTYAQVGLQPSPYSSGAPTGLTYIITNVVKQRRKATPYGFAFNEAAMTPRRWGILAALGITHGARTL